MEIDTVVVCHLTGALRSRNYLIPEQNNGWMTQIVNEKGREEKQMALSLKNNFLRYSKKNMESILPNKLTSHNLLAELGTL